MRLKVSGRVTFAIELNVRETDLLLGGIEENEQYLTQKANQASSLY